MTVFGYDRVLWQCRPSNAYKYILRWEEQRARIVEVLEYLDRTVGPGWAKRFARDMHVHPQVPRRYAARRATMTLPTIRKLEKWAYDNHGYIPPSKNELPIIPEQMFVNLFDSLTNYGNQKT